MSEIATDKKHRIRQTSQYKEVHRKLKPLLMNIIILKEQIDLNEHHVFEKRLFFHPNYNNFLRNCVKFKNRFEEAKKVSRILRELKTQQVRTPQEEVMSKLLAYLGLVESLGMTLIDAVFIVLLANGMAIHTRGPWTKHVTSVKELEKIDLGHKLDLLHSEGLGIFREFINRNTRNAVAHLKFTIQEDGEIKNRNNQVIRIDDEISKFWNGVDIINLVFEDIGYINWFKEKNAQNMLMIASLNEHDEIEENNEETEQKNGASK